MVKCYLSKLALEIDSCAAWEPWEATRRFVWRIIPRIRTGLKPFDHQISHHRGLDPIIPLHQASLRPPNLPLSAVGDIPGTGGKTIRTRTWNLWELVKFVNGQVRGENEKNLWDQQPEIPLPTGWRAGGRRRQRAWQRQGQHGMPGFRSCEQFCTFHWVSMFEKIVQCLFERSFTESRKSI